MSIIKKILFCLIFLFFGFFLFRNSALAAYMCVPIGQSCPTGYTSSYSSVYCINQTYCLFTGCHGLNGINYNAGQTNITSAACFETGESFCYSWTTWADSNPPPPSGELLDPLIGESSGLCDWHINSYCECHTGDIWEKHGSGCVGSLGCNNSNGWYSTCAAAGGGTCISTTNECRPCGNSPQVCYKKMTLITNDCSSSSECAYCEICSSGSCITDPSCGTSGCYTPVGGACDNAGGTCSTNAIANTTTQSGLCPGLSDCLCRIPIAPSCQAENAADAATCAAFGGTCDNPANYINPVYLSNLCTGGAECRCVKGCTPNCSASGDYCPSQTFSDGCGGTCTGTKSVVANDIGTCGTATSGIQSVAPSANLCADDDTPSAVSSSATAYTWTCTGVAGSCVAAENLTTSCSAVRDNSPVLSTFDIRNINGTSVAAESGRNHICQSSFTTTASPDTARFVVTYTDAQGGSDINNIQLRIGSQTFTDSTLSLSGNDATATFDISRSSISSAQLESISVLAVDNHSASGVTTSFVDTNRDFKYWDCSVSASGTGYDGSATGGLCSNSESFLTPVSTGYSLIMNDVGPGTGTDKSMTVNSPTYSSGSNSLIWGREYIFDISNFDGSDPSQVRFNGSTCSNIQFTVNNSVADPYASSVSFIADFSAVLNQDPWWQTVNGGVVSNSTIDGQVPVTCQDSQLCQTSIGALLSSPIVKNKGYQQWFYDGNSAKMVNSNTNYYYFFNQYYVKNGIGSINTGDKTISSIADLGADANNLYFIDGNLTINGNIDLGVRKFLMVIVKGDINISANVTQVDGLLVADNIYAAGTNNLPLTINGSLYAANNVDFSREYTVPSDNNTKAAVVVNHNPKLLFNLPGSISKVLINWQWGN